MSRTYISAATHAVVGTDAEGEKGVLFWHDNEFDAYCEARAARDAGGSCLVVPAPSGNLDAGMRAHVHALVMPCA